MLAVSVSADGLIAASSGVDKRILIWDLSTQTIRHTIAVKAPAGFLLFRSAANSVIGISADGSIQEWTSTLERSSAKCRIRITPCMLPLSIRPEP